MSNDQGQSIIRFFDLGSGEEIRSVPVSSGIEAVFNYTWAGGGDRIAIAAKDGRIAVLDPRHPEGIQLGKAHDSPRSFQIAWLDESHLISVGFSKGSQRRINLYSLSTDPHTIETIHSLLIDVSPSVLFPHYDPDTNILYVWGKGERVIQAYEIHPDNPTDPIAKLPGFNSGAPQLGVAWMPKTEVDVRKVEIMRALRLTSRAIEEVAFSIPRNKASLVLPAACESILN
jgi:hypothetical protein